MAERARDSLKGSSREFPQFQMHPTPRHTQHLAKVTTRNRSWLLQQYKILCLLFDLPTSKTQGSQANNNPKPTRPASIQRFSRNSNQQTHPALSPHFYLNNNQQTRQALIPPISRLHLLQRALNPLLKTATFPRPHHLKWPHQPS